MSRDERMMKKNMNSTILAASLEALAIATSRIALDHRV